MPNVAGSFAILEILLNLIALLEYETPSFMISGGFYPKKKN